jgi:arylsulfatase A-like enzyme
LLLAAIPLKRDLGVLIPPLPSGKKPNIIMILLDDMGFDDIAMHHPRTESNGKPRYLQTPNIDRLVRMSKEFRNFYVTPMCSQSRAEMLTGRDFVRTGTLLINGKFKHV